MTIRVHEISSVFTINCQTRDIAESSTAGSKHPVSSNGFPYPKLPFRPQKKTTQLSLKERTISQRH